jgi:GntR family transcriptional repressor for pyruvate dehydrogenase complex
MDLSPVVFEKFEKDILPTKIVNSLLTLIKEKQLQPGDKLPPERELAAMMNVGRPSLRAALRALAVMNVVEIYPGSGTYVSSLEPEKLVERLDFVFSVDDSSILQLFDARKTVELRTVALAATYITGEEIAELKSFLAEMQGLAGSNHSFASIELEETDREFHKLIADASRNPILHRFVSVVNQMAAESRRRTFDIPGATEETLEDHQAIIVALASHDPELAQEAMLRHLANAEKHLRQLVQQSEAQFEA